MSTQATSANSQDLIAAYAEMPVGQAPQLRRRKGEAPADAIEHDEIVACPLHLGEREFHSIFSMT